MLRTASTGLAFALGFFMGITWFAYTQMGDGRPGPDAALVAPPPPPLPPPPPWEYWSYCGGAPTCPPLPRYGGRLSADADAGGEKFLLFDGHGAGWNNERQSVELAFALAYLWRRTLVLPPVLGNFLQQASLHPIGASLDLRAMGEVVKVMSAVEFVAYAKANPGRFPGGAEAVERLEVKPMDTMETVSYRQWQGWFRGLEGGVAETIFTVGELPPRTVLGTTLAAEAELVANTTDFARFATPKRLNKTPLSLTERQMGLTALKIPPRVLLGNFYTTIYVPDPFESWRLRSAVRRGVRLRPELFEAAAAAMAAGGLVLGEYGALHSRLGDFERRYSYHYLRPDRPDKFLNQSANVEILSRHRRFYFAYRGEPKQERAMQQVFLPALQDAMASPASIVRLTGEVAEAASRIVGDIPEWEGLVEMIICSQAGTFLGSYGSTFTGYIHRLRGYMPMVNDKRILFWDSARSIQASQYPSWAKAQNPAVIAWKREWPEAFVF